MGTHISDELPLLLTGEAAGDVVRNAATHLRSCVDCQQELVSAVVAHASLTSARRFAPDMVVRPAAATTPQASTAGVAQPQEHTTAVTTPRQRATATPLPDMSAVFAQIRNEAQLEKGTGEPARSRLRVRPPLVAAAVAAGVLVGGGGAVAVQQLNHSSPSARTIALSAYDGGTVAAEASVTTSGQMRLDASALPKLDADHRYEVWLTNRNRTRMQPVGWIGADGRAVLTVPSTLLSSYSDIEVSVQQVNAPTYDYSGTSVLRGSYST